MLVFTRLLLGENYHLIELPFESLIDNVMFVCLLDELILGFCYRDLTLETGGFELASTIILVTRELTNQVKFLAGCICLFGSSCSAHLKTTFPTDSPT